MSRFFGFLAVLCLLVPMATIAHETHVYEINGEPYIFIVGSLNEPIAVDDRTGVDLRVLRADPNNPTDRRAEAVEPVTGLEATLEVELQAGDRQLRLPLAPAWDDPGAYRAIFYPTVATTYTYRFVGEVADTPINLSFTCNPAGHVGGAPDEERVQVSDRVVRIYAASDFGCPADRTDRSFPEVSAGSLELTEHLNALEESNMQTRWLSLVVLLVSFLGIVYIRRQRNIES